MKKAGDGKAFSLVVASFPAKGIITAFLALFLFQSALFETKFAFAEATGVQDVSAVVENNQVFLCKNTSDKILKMEKTTKNHMNMMNLIINSTGNKLKEHNKWSFLHNFDVKILRCI